MSGIYIPDMKMPRDCSMCPMAFYISRFYFTGCGIVHSKRYAMQDDVEYANSSERPKWCPLVAVPDHGDLIDRSAALDSLMSGMVMTGYQSRAMGCVDEIWVPTIIPADKEDTHEQP